MRIIDSKTDFYDYYQNIYRDTSLVFDRRDSYALPKEEFARNFHYEEDQRRWYGLSEINNPVKSLLLQVHNTFWLIKLIVKDTNSYGVCTDYSLELCETWKDYNAKSEVIKLSHIKFPHRIEKTEDRVNSIKFNEYKELRVFNRFAVYRSQGVASDKEERTIPILQGIGIASVVAPLDIYLALEEHFGQEKTMNERTESVGLTNDDKITSHGFDLKDSFRGKG